MRYSGPRPACQDLDGIMDEIANPLHDLINSLDLPDEVKKETKNKMEKIVLEPFLPGTSTGAKLRDFIHELSRELAK